MTILFFLLLISVNLFQAFTVMKDLNRLGRDSLGSDVPEESSARARTYAVRRLVWGLAAQVGYLLLTLGWAWGFVPLLDALAPGGALVSLILSSELFVVSAAVLLLPWAAYRTFRIEGAFGFNRTSPGLFLWDQGKSLAVTLAMVLILTTLGEAVWTLTGSWFFLWLPLAGTGLSLLMLVLFPQVIAPLFQKFTPLPEGELRTRIEALARRTGMKPAQIFLADASRRTTHANAWVGGLGPFRRIVLFDNLVQGFPPEEVEAVLAHEIGHARHRHQARFLGWSALGWTVGALVLWFLWTQPSLLFSQVPHREDFLFFVLFLLPALEFPLGFSAAALSRRYERQADAFAQKLHLGPALASALKRLSEKSLVLADPPFWSRMKAGHPSLAERLKRLDSSAER